MTNQAPSETRPRIDARSFISAPFQVCPKCQEEEFGVLILSGHNSYTRRCRKCWHTATYALPEIRKKIIYLDQFVISNIVKVLDPGSRSHRRTLENPFWLEAYKKLDHLSKLQLIICPDSHFHYDESLLSGDPPYDSLKDLYEHLSNGCTFYDYYAILRQQLDYCFWAYLNNDPDRDLELNANHVVYGDLHEWHELLRVSINSSPRPGEEEEVRNLRALQYQELVRAFEGWRSDGIQFDQSFMEEAAAWGRATIEVFASYLQRYAQLPLRFAEEVERTGTYTPQLEDILPPPAAELIFGMLRLLGSCGISEVQALAKIGEYFQSPHLLKVPYIRLSSMLYASLARKAGAGRVKPPSPGTFTDVNAIASLLPYCDAIFVDNEMVGYLGDNPLRDEVAKYPARVFSLRSKDQFLDFLDSIEKEAHPFHLRMVKEVYGDNWGEPYLSLIVDRRGSSSRG
jgi:hypothetical protein